MKNMVYKRKWIIFTICLLMYAFLFLMSLIHYEHPYHTEDITYTEYLPHKPSSILSSLDTGPVIDPEGRITSLLKPESDFVVPNVVHYIWYGDHETLKFHEYLSVISVFTFIQPDKVVIHYNNQPVGSLWANLQNEIKKHNIKAEGRPWVLQLKKSVPPSSVLGREITLMGHKSDVERLKILMDEGGIFLDLDVIAVKPFDPLRMFNFTMGIEYFGNPGRLHNGIILARPNATFLHKWLQTYKDFSKSEWDVHSSQMPYHLQFKFPHLIHVEQKSLNYPSGNDIDMIYEDRYNWIHNYALHLWSKIHDLEHGPHVIRTMNTTFGEVARLVYFGSSELLPACKPGEKSKPQCL